MSPCRAAVPCHRAVPGSCAMQLCGGGGGQVERAGGCAHLPRGCGSCGGLGWGAWGCHRERRRLRKPAAPHPHPGASRGGTPGRGGVCARGPGQVCRWLTPGSHIAPTPASSEHPHPLAVPVCPQLPVSPGSPPPLSPCPPNPSSWGGSCRDKPRGSLRAGIPFQSSRNRQGDAGGKPEVPTGFWGARGG